MAAAKNRGLTPIYKPKWQLSALSMIFNTVAVTSLIGLPFIFDSFTVPKIFALCAGIFWISFLIIRNPKKFGLPVHRFKVEFTLVGVFIACLTFSSYKSDVPFERGILGQFGRGNGSLYFVLSALLFLLTASFWSFQESKNLFTLVRGFSWIIAVYALLQSVGIDFAQLDTTKSRILLTLGNSNFSGGLLSVFFAFNIIYLAQNKSTKKLDYLILVLLSLSAFLTGAVQGILIIFLSSIFALLIYTKNHFSPSTQKRMLVVGSFFFLVLVFLGLIRRGPIKSLLERPTLKIRFEYWKIGLHMIRDNLLLGVGPDNFYDHSSIYMSPGVLHTVTATRLDAAHNWLINLTANFGILTAIPFILIIVSIVLKTIWFLFKSQQITPIFAATSGAFVFLLLDAAVSIEQPGLGIWLYFFAGLTLAMVVSPETRESPKGGFKLGRAIGIFTLLTSLLGASFSLNRIYEDFRLRNEIKIFLTGNAFENNRVSLVSHALRLKSEPEYVVKAIEILAKIGDRNSIDLVSKSAVTYNPHSLQALLIRQTVLNGLNKPDEACPILKSIIPLIPWDLELWKSLMLCNDLNIHSPQIRKLAGITQPFISAKIELENNFETQSKYYSLLAYNDFILGNYLDSKSHIKLAKHFWAEREQELADNQKKQITDSLDDSNLNLLNKLDSILEKLS